MKKILLLLASLLLASLPVHGKSKSYYDVVESTEKAMVSIHSAIGGRLVCSAVAVGDHMIQTQEHCLPPATYKGMMWLQPAGSGVYIWCLGTKVVALDGRDNALLYTPCHTWKHKVKRATNVVPYMEVYQFGWPMGMGLMYRVGVLSGRLFTSEEGLPRAEALMFSLNGTFGDSGGGIFTKQGELICTTSFVWQPITTNFQMMGCYPHRFTKEQMDYEDKDATTYGHKAR